MSYSFTGNPGNWFHDEIMNAAKKCLNIDNVRRLSARAVHVQIWRIVHLSLSIKTTFVQPEHMNNIRFVHDCRKYNSVVKIY